MQGANAVEDARLGPCRRHDPQPRRQVQGLLGQDVHDGLAGAYRGLVERIDNHQPAAWVQLAARLDHQLPEGVRRSRPALLGAAPLDALGIARQPRVQLRDQRGHQLVRIEGARVAVGAEVDPGHLGACEAEPGRNCALADARLAHQHQGSRPLVREPRVDLLSKPPASSEGERVASDLRTEVERLHARHEWESHRRERRLVSVEEVQQGREGVFVIVGEIDPVAAREQQRRPNGAVGP